MTKRKNNRDLMVEIDIFLPQGRNTDSWDFIKTMRLNVNTDYIDRDVEELTAQIAGAINQWKEEK